MAFVVSSQDIFSNSSENILFNYKLKIEN